MQTVAENLDIRSLQANKVQWRVICGFHAAGQQHSENANLSLEGINDPECFCFVLFLPVYIIPTDFMPPTSFFLLHIILLFTEGSRAA